MLRVLAPLGEQTTSVTPMTVTVLVPNDAGLAALADIEGVRAVRYDSSEPLPPEAAHAEVLVPGFLRAEEDGFFDALPELKLIQLLTAGAENWLDRLPPGVLLSTCRGAHGGSTAEWAVAVLLSMYRELGEFAESRNRRSWDYHATDTLHGKRVLVIGAGDLGQTLRRMLEPFEARVTMVGFSPREGVHGVAELPELLPSCDAVVLMVPLTSRTTGMVDAEFLAKIPTGGIVVNAARGPVVDTDALLAELNAGRLRAALDVTDPEPLPAEHPLWDAPGLLLTPHVAGSTAGSAERSYAIAAAEIERYVNGELPRNLVRGEY